MTDEQRSYDLKRPAHLVAAQVIRDIEALQMVMYGPEHSAPIHRLVEQYQQLLFERDQKIAELMSENARYREALDDISTGDWNTTDDSIICMMDTAGAALRPKKSDA